MLQKHPYRQHANTVHHPFPVHRRNSFLSIRLYKHW